MVSVNSLFLNVQLNKQICLIRSKIGYIHIFNHAISFLSLTVCILGTILADNILKHHFSLDNIMWHFMQTDSHGDNLYEVSDPTFYEKKGNNIDLPFAEFCP